MLGGYKRRAWAFNPPNRQAESNWKFMKTPKLVTIAGGILCGALLLAILLWLGNDLYMAVVTSNWTAVPAKVLSSEIVEKQRPASGRYGMPP